MNQYQILNQIIHNKINLKKLKETIDFRFREA